MSYNLPQDDVLDKLLSDMKGDGSWDYIDYKSRERSDWPVKRHVENLYIMARGYKNKESKYYNDQTVLLKMQKSLEFWCKGNYRSDNWWPQRIGVPKTLSPILILLEDEIPDSLMVKCIKILDAAGLDMIGQNKVWMSGVVLMKGLLLDDIELVKQASASILEEMKIASEGQEGLQQDFSFHQHGAQLQNGNYGLAFADNISYWMTILDGTEMSFPKEQKVALRNFLLKTIDVVTWEGTMDVSSAGRQLFYNSLYICRKYYY